MPQNARTLKTDASGFRVLGCRVLGCRVLGFEGLGFRVLLQGFRVEGVGNADAKHGSPPWTGEYAQCSRNNIHKTTSHLKSAYLSLKP